MKRSTVFLILLIFTYTINVCDKKNPVNVSKQTCTISGIITQDSLRLAGVLVSFSDDSSLTTDGSGSYSKTVKYGSDLTIIPSKIGYSFEPESLRIAGIHEDKSGQNFSAIKTGPSVDDLVGTYRLDHWKICNEDGCHNDTASGCTPFGKMTISSTGAVNQTYDYCTDNIHWGGQRQSNFWIDSFKKEDGYLKIIFGPLRGGIEPVAKGYINGETIIIGAMNNMVFYECTWTRTSRMVEKATIL